MRKSFHFMILLEVIRKFRRNRTISKLLRHLVTSSHEI